MLPLLALATLTFTPVVGFTSDSVYKNENVLVLEVKENYEEETLVSKDLIIKERNLLGYTIYDNPDTDYIDGLKFDESWVYDWTVKNYDDSVAHTFTVKTVYTDDIAGMLASAKDGDWSRALSNPLILVQLFYYVLAAFSIVLGGFGLLKSKKRKLKTTEEITASIRSKATDASESLKEMSIGLITSIVTPAFTKLQTQNQAIIEALILAQSGDSKSKLALIDLLKNTATEDVEAFSKSIESTIKTADLAKEKAKVEAEKVIKQLSEESETTDEIGGISI